MRDFLAFASVSVALLGGGGVSAVDQSELGCPPAVYCACHGRWAAGRDWLVDGLARWFFSRGVVRQLAYVHLYIEI